MGDDETSRWLRLGELLTARRIALGGGNRAEWLRQNGYERKARIISDIELGKRTNYERGTLMEIEHLYRWLPGSVTEVLDGGDPMTNSVDVQKKMRRHLADIRGGVEDVESDESPGTVGGDQQDDPVLFLLTPEENRRLARLPEDERKRVLDAARAAARATADALLGTGDEE